MCSSDLTFPNDAAAIVERSPFEVDLTATDRVSETATQTPPPPPSKFRKFLKASKNGLKGCARILMPVVAVGGLAASAWFGGYYLIKELS